MDKNQKLYLAAFAFALFSIIIIGLAYFFLTPTELISLPLAYAAGLSMIFLPCTLPLAFVIIPISMRESPRKGFTMALLFGLGLVVTITIYGIFSALVGGIFNLQAANIIFLTIGGAAAYLFGLSELGLINFTGPIFHAALPESLRKSGDYLKMFFMGLLLGNMGVGCPNPAFYVMLSYIAASANLITGFSLGLVHAIGRATPLVFLSVLAILGFDATKKLVSGSKSVGKFLGWALIFVGALLLVTGGPFKPWYEQSVFHSSVNNFLLSATAGKIGEQGPEPEFEVPFVPQWAAPYFFVLLIAAPIIFSRFRKPMEVHEHA